MPASPSDPVSPPHDPAADVDEAVRRLGPLPAPEIALVLGSGLGPLADAVETPRAVATTDLPGYPPSTVAGHRGRLVFGTLEGRRVVVLQGRLHCYEGHSIHAVTFPIRLVHALGARKLLVTNAAGGLHPDWPPGTLMFITDHINFTFTGPPVRTDGPARPDGSPRPYHVPFYDPDWLDRAEATALRLGLSTRRGVYLWTSGPSYETPAEIRAFRRLGADAVGMSTVPEVLQACRLGMDVLGLSTITNLAAGLSPAPLAHEDVLAVGRTVRGALQRLIRGLIRAL